MGGGGQGRPGPDEPLPSRSISGGSQSVRGAAPMKLNSAGDPQRPHLARLVVGQLDLAEMVVAGHPPDLGVAEHLDPGVLLDPPGQVVGHVLVQVVAADHEVDLPDLAGEEDGGLAGGVAAADDHDLRPLAHLGLDGGRGVVDAAALEPLATLDAEPAVVGPGGDQQALGVDMVAAVEVEHRVPVVEGQARDLGRDGRTRPNLLACTTARSASSAPVMPVGKPR